MVSCSIQYVQTITMCDGWVSVKWCHMDAGEDELHDIATQPTLLAYEQDLHIP